jgi:long-chain acyl-CoA synthetase
MLVQDFLEESARRIPDKVALICGEERLAYGEVDSRSNATARRLKSLGVERQDRVAVLLDNSSESVVALFGILKADAVFLMLSPTIKAAKLAHILKDCGAKVLITHSTKATVVEHALFKSPTVEHVLWMGKDQASDFFPATNTETPTQNSNIDLDLATIIYTSGSTGDPKGVMMTHLSIAAASASIIAYLDNREDDIIMNVLPLSFDYGLYQVLMAFRFGGTVVLEKSFAYPYQIIKRMVQEHATGFPGVPTLFAILLGMKEPEKLKIPSLRYLTSTGAALPDSHIARLRRLYPEARIYSMYGLTECKRVSFLPPKELGNRPGSVGRGMPNEEVWVVDSQGNRLGPGEVGELVVRGSNVMRGYWGLPDETARVLKPGKYPGEVVLFTGDLFKMDQDGYLYFIARKDDMIKTRGELVSPREIEQSLCTLDGVAEAAVIGVPDDILGKAIVAYIRCEDGYQLDVKSVLRHCQNHLENFMVPKLIRLVTSFERTAAGKIDIQHLKTMEMLT